MKKLFLVAVMAGGLGVTCYISPTARGWVWSETRTLTGWSEQARKADPVGFVSHVERQLRQDQKDLKETRQTLAAEIGELTKKQREQTALRDQSQQLASDFRTAWQGGRFPVTIRNAAYTEGELTSQVSSLLAEIEGYATTVERLSRVRIEAEQKLEELTVRIEKTESEIASLGTQRELVRARVLTDSGERLLAQVDNLLEVNQQVLLSNPVRSTRDLLTATESPRQGRATNDRVIAFLRSCEPSVPRDSVSQSQNRVQQNHAVAKPTGGSILNESPVSIQQQ